MLPSSLKLLSLNLPISASQRHQFYTLLGRFLEDGIPLYDGLHAMDRQYRNHRHPLSRLTGQALRRLRGEGSGPISLGDAFADLIPKEEQLAISSGEDAGQIATGLASAARISAHAASIRQIIRTEMAYPAFLLVLLSALLLGIGQLFIPVLEQVLPVENWPQDARRLLQLTHLGELLVPASLITLGLVMAGFQFSRHRLVGSLRDWLDLYVLPWSLQRRISGALILSYVASLIGSGIPLSQALERLEQGSSPWQRDHVNRIRTRLRLGRAEGEALAIPLFDEQLRWQIELYAQLSSFAHGLQSLADHLISITRERIARTFLVIRYLLMLVITALIAWIYLIFVSVTMVARSLT